MPRKSLYTIVTMPENGAGFEKNQLMTLFDSMMNTGGIFSHVYNSMATIAGEDVSQIYWRLWEIERNPGIPVGDAGTGYSSDDKSRYFFEYIDHTDTDLNPRIALEYSRHSGFEIRGTCFTSTGATEVRVDSLKTKEAICAMLLAIMRHEQNNHDFIAVVSNFRRDYSQMFSRGVAACFQTLQAIYGHLCDTVDPQKENTTTGFFKVSQAMLNYTSKNLKRVLDGEQFGYVNGTDGTVNIVGGMQATLVLEPGNRPESVIAEPIVIMPLANQPSSSSGHASLTPKMFALRPEREYSIAETPRLLSVPDWYIPVKDIFKIAHAIHASSRFDRPYRNVLLRGPAGTGKTEGAKAIASMLGLPYGHVTGHAEMEFFDITSSLIPRTESELKTLEEFIEYLTFALIESNVHVPSFSLMSSMPDSAYFDITGTVKDDATERDCLVAVSAKLISMVKQDRGMYSGSESKFKIVKSDLVNGLENGWVVELQEMNTIQKPGVLVGLNSILEYGALALPTGETIHRHPDAVVVFTQNVGYAGTTDANQSVFSRVEVKCDLPHPTEDEMVGRIKKHVPGLATPKIRTIVQACADIRDRCAAEIEGGSVGTREAINWAKMSVVLDGNIREAAEYTVLPSCGEDPDDIARIRVAVINNIDGG